MTADYDLIVIGGSAAGIHAAVAAAYLNARVALIEPQQCPTNWLGDGAIYAHALRQVGCVLKQVRSAPQFGIHTPPEIQSQDFTEAMQWAQAVVTTCSEQQSPEILGALGIDAIAGTAEFYRLPRLGVAVNNRRLRSRAYLIATGSRPSIPEIAGLETMGYLTPTALWQSDLPQKLSGRWIVVGGGAIGTQLAQTLARLDGEVTLVISSDRILPTEEPEATSLLQAQLEAEGVCVLTQSPVTQVKWLEGTKWIQAGDQALEADEILLATGQQPNLDSLNLEGVGVEFNAEGLVLNEKLQTTNPRIYGCGDVAGGYQFPHLAQYEADIALKNALFFPWFKVDYQGIPWAIFTDPPLARVGLTEAQARRRYGKDVLVVRQYYKVLDQAQLLGETTGFCKLVVRQNGEILGASIVGAQASESIGEIALAIRQKIKMGAIADLPHACATLTEIVGKTAIEWRRQRWRGNETLQNFLEGFFNLRRHWSR